MQSKRADYIYIERVVGSKNHLCIQESTAAQYQVVHIQQMLKENVECKWMGRQRLKWRDKQLFHAAKSFWSEHTMVVGNERITKEWKMPNTLFALKKQVLLTNVKSIILNILETRSMKQGRKSFLLVLDSMEWLYKDIELLLWEVKRFYEDIYIVLKRAAFQAEDLCDMFWEECGLFIPMMEEEVAKKMDFDTIFFLVEKMGDGEEEYSFVHRCAVPEWEENQFQSLLFVALNDTINVSMKGNG